MCQEYKTATSLLRKFNRAFGEGSTITTPVPEIQLKKVIFLCLKFTLVGITILVA